MTDLDAKGIRVTIYDLDKKGAGHPSWVLPMGGGRVKRDDRLSVEVCPEVDMSVERWRDHNEIIRIAREVEIDRGFIWQGDEIVVGDDILVGRDALKLLAELNRRANKRSSGPGKEYEQGFQDGIDAALDAARSGIESARKKPA